MNMPIMLSIQGRQSYAGQDPETIRLDTEGTMECQDGGWNIAYEESELTGLTGVTTTFRVEPNKITLQRTGRLSSIMVFQEGVSHDSLYKTEYGALKITVCALRMLYDITEDGGYIDIVYRILIEDTEAGEIDYHLDIREKQLA